MNVKRPQSTPPMIKLEQFLPYRLNVVAEAVSRSLSQLYRSRHGISIAEWRVVATLGQYQRMTAKQIGTHSRMHKTKVSRAVANLTGRGLIEQAANSEDLRETFLKLTGNGRKVYGDLVPRALAFADELGESFTTQERAVLDKLLTKLENRALNGEKPEGG